MAVLLADRSLGVRRATRSVPDAHGYEVPTAGPLDGPWPGRAEERADGSWVLALDPEAWPVAPDDTVEEPGSGEQWTVTSADLLEHKVDDAVSYIRCEALRRTTGTVPTRPNQTG